MTKENYKIINDLKSITGSRYILTAKWNKQAYSKGWRYGEGEALAVAKPGTLLEIWEILEVCVSSDIIVIMQAANTGLTGGSTPYGYDYDRPIVLSILCVLMIFISSMMGIKLLDFLEVHYLGLKINCYHMEENLIL